VGALVGWLSRSSACSQHTVNAATEWTQYRSRPLKVRTVFLITHAFRVHPSPGGFKGQCSMWCNISSGQSPPGASLPLAHVKLAVIQAPKTHCLRAHRSNQYFPRNTASIGQSCHEAGHSVTVGRALLVSQISSVGCCI
jgi:hypothetical protein